MANKIQLRRDTAGNWARINPILADGEPGLDIDNNKIKLGDGNTAWTQLPYLSSPEHTRLVSGSKVLALDTDGKLHLPYGGDIVNAAGTSVLTAPIDLSSYANNISINSEGKGLTVDGAGLKRFGFMKYSGIEGSITHTSQVPLRVGRTSTSDVTTATVNEFVTEIYVGTTGHVRISDDPFNNINEPTERLEVVGNIDTTGLVKFSGTGLSAPTVSTRSAGTKLVIWPEVNVSGHADYAIGMEDSYLWNSVPTATTGFKWYAGNDAVLTLAGDGHLYVRSIIEAYGDTDLVLRTVKSQAAPGGYGEFDLRLSATNGKLTIPGTLGFGDGTTQTSAYQVTAAPTSSKGVSGHKAGMVAFDNGNFYYCKADYAAVASTITLTVNNIRGPAQNAAYSNNGGGMGTMVGFDGPIAGLASGQTFTYNAVQYTIQDVSNTSNQYAYIVFTPQMDVPTTAGITAGTQFSISTGLTQPDIWVKTAWTSTSW